MISITTHGAVGDGETDCTPAIQRTIDAVASHGGGTVLVPAGRFVTGTIWLRSNITLHLEAGAALLGSRSVEAFPMWTNAWEGPTSTTRAALVCGENLDNVAITGRGTIDGRGEMWWEMQKKLESSMKIMRPRLVRLVDCRNLLVEGVTLTNSPAWTLNPVACSNVNVRGITVLNPPNSPNTDGINPDSCREVRISDCHIDVGDDCVTIKSGSEEEPRREYRPCENVVVTNCTMVHGHGGVVIGSEMSGGVKNVAISNCTFVGTDRGIRIKSRRGRGNGRAAAVEDVRASNIIMDGVLCPITVNLFYGCGAWGESKVTDKRPQPVTDDTPRIRRISYSNITAKNAKLAAAFMMGLPEMFVEDISMNDVSIWMDRDATEPGEPDMAPGIERLCRAGMMLKNARRVRLNNVHVFDAVGEAIRHENCEDIQVE